MPRSTGPLRIALIGCGRIARWHAARLANDGRARIAVCCDPDKAQAEQFRDELAPDAVVERDAARAFAVDQLDAAVIASPTQQHYEHARAALDAGLHVLCEKPLCLDREQIVDLIERSRRLDRVLSVSYQRRYKPLYQTARRELVDRAELYGPLQEVHVFVCERWQQTIHGTWRDDPAVGAGYFGDAGAHQLDVVSYIAGSSPKSVYAESDRHNSRVEVVTRAVGRLTCGAGLVAHFVGNAHHWREDIHFHCRDADLLLRSEQVDHGQLLRGQENRLTMIDDFLPGGSPDAALVDAILGGGTTLSPPECALDTFDWTTAVVKSIRTGERVSW